LDEAHALLQLRAPLLELLDLLNHAVQARGFLLRRGDLEVDLRRFLRQRPVAPANQSGGEDEDQAARDRHLLAGQVDAEALLWSRSALLREKVDANHRSPTLLNARPTATADEASTDSGSLTPNFAGSNAIFLNGSKTSTVVPNRSRSASAKPSTRDAPPL